MKRRVNALASSTSKVAKRKSWRDDAGDDSPLHFSQESGDEALSDGGEQVQTRAGSGGAAAAAGAASANPVVFLDLEVAGRARGRIFLELFADAAPRAAGNFRALCVGIEQDGRTIGFKGSELDKVLPGRLAEGGDLDSSVDLPAVERGSSMPSLRHAKGGLLTMDSGSPSFGSPRFQITLRAQPELDGRQVVFGQLLQADGQSKSLHPLHWVEAVGSPSGVPREAVVITDCGECGAAEAETLLGAMVMAAQIDRTPETQDDRYGRAGIVHGRLQDALSDATIDEALELTDDLLEHLEYKAKKARQDPSKDSKAIELEAVLKDLSAVLQDIEHKAGEVKGFDGSKAGKNVKAQLIRAREVEGLLTRMY